MHSGHKVSRFRINELLNDYEGEELVRLIFEYLKRYIAKDAPLYEVGMTVVKQVFITIGRHDLSFSIEIRKSSTLPEQWTWDQFWRVCEYKMGDEFFVYESRNDFELAKYLEFIRLPGIFSN